MSSGTFSGQWKEGFAPVPESARETFQRIIECADMRGALCLVSARRKRDGAQVTLLCYHYRADAIHFITPLAEIIDSEEPTEDYDAPGHERMEGGRMENEDAE